MPDRKLIFFNFMDDGGDIREKEGSPDREESHTSVDLSLSLGCTPSPAATDKVKQDKKSEKSSGGFPSESKKAGTDAGISLELSLSRGCISTRTDEEKQLIQYKESSDDEYTADLDVRDMTCMEKSSGASSPEASDISLELCLALRNSLGVEAGNHRNRNNNGGLTLALNDGFNFTCNKKRKRVESPNLSSNRNKRRRLAEAEVRAGQEHDPWCIKKKLTTSDLSDMSRLLLPKKLVESHILPHWDAQWKQQIYKDTGLGVSVFDCDTNNDHALVFKRWKNGAYVFIQNWIPNFVSRRGLKLNDEIGLYWDIPNSRFNFSVLNRAPRE
ncbi:hypothetical protein HRI_003319100 [Hibiscus trionum]|uniref:TF-B3 domain-containing protein n=1 Tax=Hibiscus trionum TaxID=183268 RepID=A0A9W7MCI9_HIBTR|nr:hypothetical protein HRI_003319100 [Hibiscus trionum]